MAQPQTIDTANPHLTVKVNAKWANGVAPGYRPTSGSGLTLNLSPGTAFSSGAIVSYTGGTLSLTNNATNYVFLDPSAGFAPGFNTTGFSAGVFPIAQVTTLSGAITAIIDDRTFFVNSPAAGGGTLPSVGLVVEIAVTSPSPGNFTVAHLQGQAPAVALVEMTSDGDIWFQTSRYDATNVYLAASDTGLTARVSLWFLRADAEKAFTTSAPGNFSVAHGMGVTPALALIQRTGPGGIWFQSAIADATNVLLDASDSGITGFVEVWKNLPAPLVIKHAVLALAPSVAGPFTVAHGLGITPTMTVVKMTSAGLIHEATGADATNIYLTASDGGITGKAEVWAT